MIDKEAAWLGSREASDRLGVKLATLYAYASRGLVESVPGEGRRGRLYSSRDIERLRVRHRARSGHAPVAASALRYGEPVLDTRISEVGADGPRYRGYLATDLCRDGVSFERVAELLWTGTLPDAAGPRAALQCDAAQLWPLFAGRAALPKMALLLGALGLADGDRHAASDAAEFARARALFHWLACAPSARPPRQPAGSRVAGTLLAALRVPQTPTLISNVIAH